jgi:hypothetical protein
MGRRAHCLFKTERKINLIQTELKTKQYTLSPAAGKRLIAKSLLQLPTIFEALEKKRLSPDIFLVVN